MLLIVVNSGRSGRKSKSLGIATRWLVNPIWKLRKSRSVVIGGPQQSPSKRLRLGPSLSQTPNEETPKLTRAASSATFHGWKDVDLIVKTSENLVVGEDDDDLNEGFCHYSIMDDE